MTSEFNFPTDHYFGYYSVLCAPINASQETITLAYLSLFYAIKTGVEKNLSIEELEKAFQILHNVEERKKHDLALSDVIKAREKKLQEQLPNKEKILADEKKERTAKSMNSFDVFIFCCLFLLAFIYGYLDPIKTLTQDHNAPDASPTTQYEIAPPVLSVDKTVTEETSNRSEVVEKPIEHQNHTVENKPKKEISKPTNTTRNQVF